MEFGKRDDKNLDAPQFLAMFTTLEFWLHHKLNSEHVHRLNRMTT